MFAFLDRIVSRLRWRRGLGHAVRILGGGSILVGLLIALATWIHVPFATPLALALLALTAIGAGACLLRNPYTRADAAQIADLALGTRSLFVTAYELVAGENDHGCVQRATSVASDTDPQQIVAISPRPLFGGLLMASAATAAIALVPLAPLGPSPATEDNAQAAAAHLEKANGRLERSEDSDHRQRVQRLARKLKAGQISKRAAMEELGELKRQLRAKSLREKTRQLRAARALSRAGGTLSRNPVSQQLGRQLQRGASASTNPGAQRQELRRSLRELAKRNKAEREAGARALEEAARQAGQAGDKELAQALRAAAQAVRDGTPEAIDATADQLADASIPKAGDGGRERLLQDLSNAQAALDGQRPQPGAESEQAITGTPRNWSDLAEGNANTGGLGHSDEARPASAGEDSHQDADRFHKEERESWNEEYRELYEAALLKDSSRIATKVQGERTGGGKVKVVQGGQQAPSRELARDAIGKIPVAYAEQAQEAIGSQTVPPAYRKAVRNYFDADQ